MNKMSVIKKHNGTIEIKVVILMKYIGDIVIPLKVHFYRVELYKSISTVYIYTVSFMLCATLFY